MSLCLSAPSSSLRCRTRHGYSTSRGVSRSPRSIGPLRQRPWARQCLRARAPREARTPSPTRTSTRNASTDSRRMTRTSLGRNRVAIALHSAEERGRTREGPRRIGRARRPGPNSRSAATNRPRNSDDPLRPNTECDCTAPVMNY